MFGYYSLQVYLYIYMDKPDAAWCTENKEALAAVQMYYVRLY